MTKEESQKLWDHIMGFAEASSDFQGEMYSEFGEYDRIKQLMKLKRDRFDKLVSLFCSITGHMPKPVNKSVVEDYPEFHAYEMEKVC